MAGTKVPPSFDPRGCDRHLTRWLRGRHTCINNSDGTCPSLVPGWRRIYAEPVARAATPAIAALLAAEVPHEVLQYHHDPRNESFGDEAVDELARGRGGRPGAGLQDARRSRCPRGWPSRCSRCRSKLSLKAAAAALGVPKATMADRAAAERSTATSSAGSPRSASASALPTVVDALGAAVGPGAVQRGQARLGRRGAPAGPDPADQRGHRRHPRVLR